MQSIRRTAVTAARKGRTTLPRQPRRFAHDEHAHGHGHTPAANESIGVGFWGVVAVFPLGYGLYAISRQDPNSPSFLTRIIHQYTEKQDELAAYNDVHVRLQEQAGSDRVLFQHSHSQEHVPVKFPELLTSGSPFNIIAGSQVNLSETMEKFRREANQDNERKLEAMRTNTIKAEQPIEKLDPPKKGGY
ncbi:hypothetical protein B0J11DRAFT_506783 [Dendryphion nanum]|uniref:Uncharacterized protein n=1 Tax=Dendryphion nanum TaxID=256645 RepID=A0A9P9DR27_9PLEO|nr:hypothetical protein B0J11DRAFT_506783 [Dendryphion nanum]